MSGVPFHVVFKSALGVAAEKPYAYQCLLAGGPDADPSGNFTHGTTCRSQLIDVPTGLGKTAGVVLAWLWNRVLQPDEEARRAWPRRLVYCLPMRTLVEQTRDCVRGWLKSIGDLEWENGTSHAGKIGVHVLMGGEDAAPWDIHPEEEAILIGTQDMLLSRALNRGYGMSRYRWPLHFGLLNTDCLWVYDEVQLMGCGLPTTAQLEGFRTRQGGTGSHSWWMSATSEIDWLSAYDLDPGSMGLPVRLPDEDLASGGQATKILGARKPIEKVEATGSDLAALAKLILAESGRTDGLTVVVVNTVKTARALFEKLERLMSKSASAPLLLHSRYRPADRAARLNEILAMEGRRGIVVSTQVIEAGVDLSAATLFTELAPWSSLVQRFGRCNRRGTEPHAKIFWFEPGSVQPYSDEQLAEARDRLSDPTLKSASPIDLRGVPIPAVDRPASSHVLRRKDLIELFDTTPDLAGNDLDIDRWVREPDEGSVQVFWREWDGSSKGFRPVSDERQPRREELCPAPISEFKDFLKNTAGGAWRWDYLTGEWVTAKDREIYPGQNYLIPAERGGYSVKTGWTPKAVEPVEPIACMPGNVVDAKPDDDPLSELPVGTWQSIAQHTDEVCAELASILSRITVGHARLLALAARWHDWGKVHPAFKAKLKAESAKEREAHLGTAPAAKAPSYAWSSERLPREAAHGDSRRKYFRHELASALGILHPRTPISADRRERDLVAYLVAAHHGKVRLSIRSMPDEWTAVDRARFARGVWDGDILESVALGGAPGAEVFAPRITLSLEPMELGLGETEPFIGLPSWSERMLELRDTIGIFQLAYLEALLRAADERASKLAARWRRETPSEAEVGSRVEKSGKQSVAE